MRLMNRWSSIFFSSNRIMISCSMLSKNPFDTGPLALNSLQRCRAGAFWSESMRVFGKDRFIDSFQKHSCHVLYQCIIACWNSEWSPLPIRLGDVYSPGRF